MDEGTESAGQQRPLPCHDSSLELDQDQDTRGSDDEFSSTHAESGEEDKSPRALKRKRLPLSRAGLAQKKRKHHLHQSSTLQSRALSKSRRHSPKSHSPCGHGSKVAALSSAEVRLPSSASTAPHAMDTDMPLSCSNLGGSSSDTLPTLTEVTFRPYSLHCCSFTAIIRDGYDGRGVSFSQLASLIESIGHMGKIDDFTIKSIEQHSFLLTGLSRHTLSRPSPSGTAVLTAAEAVPTSKVTTRTRPQYDRAVEARTLASRRSELSSSDDDNGLSESDSEPSSDDDGCLSDDRQHVRARVSRADGQRWTSSACWHTRKRASLGNGSLASSQAGLSPQFVRVGTWSGPGATRLPSAGEQPAARPLCEPGN